jgi:hypothetical protein
MPPQITLWLTANPSGDCDNPPADCLAIPLRPALSQHLADGFILSINETEASVAVHLDLPADAGDLSTFSETVLLPPPGETNVLNRP